LVINQKKVQIGVSVVAIVKTERLALIVVALYQCREMDVKEEHRVAIKFCRKVDFSATKPGTDSEGLR
jgi:hypothetical protein